MKPYTKPTSEIIELVTAPILEGSIWVDNGDNGTANPNGGDQYSGEHRSDWDNIWENM